MSCLPLSLGLIDWGDPCYQDLTQQMDSGDPIYSALANLLLVLDSPARPFILTYVTGTGQKSSPPPTELPLGYPSPIL